MADFETEDGVLHIGDGVRLVGEAHAPEAVVVDGVFSGEITSRKLVVGPTGSVRGQIVVMEADIHGVVSADIVAKQSLIARSTARIDGAWRVGEIMAERGAILNGTAGAESLRIEAEPAAPVAPVRAVTPTLDNAGDRPRVELIQGQKRLAVGRR